MCCYLLRLRKKFYDRRDLYSFLIEYDLKCEMQNVKDYNLFNLEFRWLHNGDEMSFPASAISLRSLWLSKNFEIIQRRVTTSRLIFNYRISRSVIVFIFM